MPAMNKLGFAFVFAALIAAPQAWAQVYKCVDAAGKTVYLQSPCPAGQSSKVLSSSPPPAQETPAAQKPGAKAPLTPEQEFKKRQQERAETDKKTAEQGADAKRRQENCARARENMALLDYGGRVARVNEKGERYFLEDAQIAQEKAKAQASVNEWCK